MSEHEKRVPIAATIYERLEMKDEGLEGSVYDDIDGMSIDEMEEYFQDADPIAFL